VSLFSPTDDVRIEKLRPLIPPAILMENHPLSDEGAAFISKCRAATADILRGTDSRLVVVVGPCSIHDVKAGREYAQRLAEVSSRLAPDLLLLMRVYFEKPRTTVGWKGLINDPRLDGSFAINEGLGLARALLVDLAALQLGVGCEFLDTLTPQFIADLVSWGAIGARTTESQVHRELASGLSMPVGFKNGTSGDLQIAIDAVRASSNPHHFLSVTKQGVAAIVATRGNDTCHVILRGGKSRTNFDSSSVAEAAGLLQKARLNPRVMVDCSHGNSSKNPANQTLVAKDIARQLGEGSRSIFGVMLESNLVGGRQDQEQNKPLTYGQSITDGCLSWEETVPVLEELAAGVRSGRNRSGG
jgi:3-deoxy-7-phosphoheptulonate synthase